MSLAKITRPQCPWLKDENVKDLQTKRNNLRKEAHETKSEEKWNEYRGLKNEVKRKIKTTKRKFYKAALNSKNPKEVWNTINRILHPPPKPLAFDVTSTNQFFASTAERVTGATPASRGELENLVNNLQSNHHSSFTMRHATFDEVYKHLKSLRQDHIPAKYIVPVADELCSVLTHIINEAIDSKTFPAQWKLARVAPIPKTNNPTTISDLRPISILPVLSKIFEKVILQQITIFIEAQSLYKTKMSGFRKGHSTTTLLMKLKSDITTSLKKGEASLLVLADYSKAFDTVDYRVVMQNFLSLGSRTTSLNFCCPTFSIESKSLKLTIVCLIPFLFISAFHKARF